MQHLKTVLTTRRASLFCALSLGAMLAGCGGGGDASPPTPAPVVVTGPTTLQITDSVVGTGATAAVGNTLTVNYTGWLYSATALNFKGTQFDTSVGKQPFVFRLGAGQVIAGWDQGLVGMREGGTRTLIIPSSLGYGSAGAGTAIPPNTAIVFTVDLIKVQ